jgi:hypothetical protein
LGKRISLTCLIDGVTLKDKVHDNSYEIHDKVTAPPTDTHYHTVDDTKKDTNLGDFVAVIGWHFIAMI